MARASTICAGAIARGPGLLLVHGNAAHAHWWDFIAPFLARDYNVAAMDLSGMGDSDWRPDGYAMEMFAREEIAVCEDAGMFKLDEPPVIVAHSFGGFVTMLTGGLYGDRLAGVVIVDSPVNPPDRPGGPPKREIKPHNVYPIACRGDGAVSADAAADLRESLHRRLGGAAFAEGGRGGFTWKFDPAIWQRFSIGDTAERLKATRCRIAVFRGEHSVLLPPQIGEYMFNLLGRVGADGRNPAGPASHHAGPAAGAGGGPACAAGGLGTFHGHAKGPVKAAF